MMMKAALLLIGVTAVAGDCVLQPGFHLVPSVKNPGDLTCKPCPRSTYGIRNFSHSDPLNMFQCIPCEPGTFSLVEGSVECHANTCGAGQMRIPGGKPDSTDSCFTCPNDGNYARDSENKCICAEGTEMKENKCVPCPAMHYQDETNQGNCKPCPLDTFQFEQGASNCESATCGAGEYLKRTLSAPGYECVACPANHVAAGTAMRLKCEACPFGKYAKPDQSACLENTCTTGKYRSANTCIKCDIGEYQDHDGAVDCKSCPAGSNTTHTGAVSASACKKSCPAGEHSVHGACQKCAVGKFSSVEGSTYCEQCAKGQWSFDAGGTTCTTISECNAGEYTDPSYNPNVVSSNACLSCPKGKYTPTAGMHFCRTCPENHHTWSDGQSDCTGVSCDIGYFKRLETDSSCTRCPAGKFQDRRNRVTCNTCPEGKYQFDQGQATCVDLSCEAGSFKGSKLASCLQCNENTFSTRAGSIECTPCPAGRYAQGTGNTECAVKTCKPGRKVSGNSCAPCPKNEYSPSRGTQTSCKTCPTGTTTDSLAGQSACWTAAVADEVTQVNYHVCGDHLGTSDKPLQCSWSNVTTQATGGGSPFAVVHPAGAQAGWHFVLRVTHRDSNNNGYGTNASNSYLRPLQKHKCGMVLQSNGQYTCRCWCWTDHATTKPGHKYHTTDLDGSNGLTNNASIARQQWHPATDTSHYGSQSRVNLNGVEFKKYQKGNLVTHTKSAFYDKYKDAI